ncbi:MAG: hypothetical protein NXH84_00830 [Rhodobacteraceae bacterium]|jgi:hypothetical protein|nr:hypothetical protein [Paracoccaceae bacterium]
MQTTGLILLLAAGFIVLFGGGNGGQAALPTGITPNNMTLISGIVR